MNNRIPQSFIQDLIARCDIVELIQSRVTLKKTGRNYSACCPFHDEKTPSFTVSPDKQFYHCFGCSANGNAIGFLMEYDRMEFVDAIHYLASQFGLEIPTEQNQQTQNNYQPLLALLQKVSHFYQTQLRASPEAIAYFKQRGLSGQIAKRYGLGFAPAGWDKINMLINNNAKNKNLLIQGGVLIQKDHHKTYDRFRNRIIFPIRNTRGHTIGFGGRVLDNSLPKYLNSPETPVFHKSQELYGLYEARQQLRNFEQVLIVEGYMDVVSLAEHGIHYAVATLGTASNPRHLQKLLRYTNQIIFCFDGDRAGKNAAWKALIMSLPLLRDGIHIRFLFLPENEDPDSWVRKIGQQTFEQKIQQATPLVDVFFNELREQYPIHSASGKAAFAKQAMSHLNNMPAGIFQELLQQQLANILQVNIDHLKQMATQSTYQHTPADKPSTAEKPVSISSQHQLPPIYLASALLLQNPTLAQKIDSPTELQNITLDGMPLLLQLVDKLKKDSTLPIGQLLSQYRSKQEQQLIAELAARPLSIPETGVAQEFQDVLTQLKQLGQQQRRQKLIEKAKQSGLTQAEREYLQDLLKDKADNG